MYNKTAYYRVELVGTGYTLQRQVGGVITRSAGVKIQGKIDFAKPGGVKFAPVRCDLAL